MENARLCTFRDDSAAVYVSDTGVRRFVARSYAPHYRRLMDSGLYQKLVGDGLLVDHVELESPTNPGVHTRDSDYLYLLAPRRIPFVSYPYEWSFSQLKDAALLTLKIQKIALLHDMILKDANGWNIQFDKGQPVFIDTSSFEAYVEGKPWAAYGQFCRFFLLPLTLMARRDLRLNSLLQVYPDGIPLDLGVKLLPLSTWKDFGLAGHLLTTTLSHSIYQKSQSTKGAKAAIQAPAAESATTSDSSNSALAAGVTCDSGIKVSRTNLNHILDNLIQIISGLKLKKDDTTWSDYYQDNSYSAQGHQSKQALVESIIKSSSPQKVFDIGANTGVYSRIAAKQGASVISMDLDARCVELNYSLVKANGETNILPLTMDLTVPSPALGWDLEERLSIFERGKCDLLMALALVHHLCVGRGINLQRIASCFAALTSDLIIEFVPRGDIQVLRLLEQRTDDCPGYNQESFEKAFLEHFTLVEKHQIEDSPRTIYYFKKV